MKGDYSRITFDPAKHFSGVRLQQGRVQLDADFNEHVDIEAHRDEETTRDVVGRMGAPYDGGGFRVQVASLLRGVAIAGSTAYAVGADALLLKSKDDDPWTVVDAPEGTDDLTAVFLVAQDAGFAVGLAATILALTPAGWTRHAVPAGVDADLHGVAAVGDAAWAIGARGTILRGGSSGNWLAQSRPDGLDVTLRAVDFVDGEHGWIVGDGATILVTEDGTTWTRQKAPHGTGNLLAVAAAAERRAYAVGEDGTILAWDGSAWERQESPVAANLRAVRFRDAETGIAVGDDGAIVATQNGGETWTPEAALRHDLAGVALKGFHGLAVGGNVCLKRQPSDTADIPTKWIAGPALPAEGRSLSLSAGAMYIEGVRVVNEAETALTAQPDLAFVRPPATDAPVFPPGDPGTYGVYLEVFEEHVTALELEELREVALGGPDTATRTRTVWQARLHRHELADDLTCEALAAVLPPRPAADAHLRARAEPGEQPAEDCFVAGRGGYRRLENQLYRVEIHRPGGSGDATFKWSRDNGMVAARLEALDEATRSVTVSDAGRDEVHGFGPGQWIEINDNSRALRGGPGVLVQVNSVRGEVLEVDLTGIDPGTLSIARFSDRPIVRRWDGCGNVVTGGWLDLEDGVQIEFAGTGFATGDYWVIPARSVNSAVEWPLVAGLPRFKESAGPRRRFAPLALVTLGDRGTWSNPIDCRTRFPSLTGLVHFFYVGGDGQEALPDLRASQPHFVKLDRPLQVGVSNWRWPVSEARVQFDIVEGGGRLDGTSKTSVTVLTDEDGVARCDWYLNGTVSGSVLTQQVRATLLDDNGNVMQTPIVFNGSLSLASKVGYDGSECGTLQNEKTVQAAITKLSRLARIFPLSGTGFDLGPGETSVNLEVIVVNECGPVSKASVAFSALEGSGSVPSSPVQTGDDGRAKVVWELDSKRPRQEVRASLLSVPDGTGKHLPDETTFVANLKAASQIAYEPACPLLGKAQTVQDAIDALATFPRLYHVTGDGSHALPDERVHLEVGVASDCGPAEEGRPVQFIVREGDGGLEEADDGVVPIVEGRARCVYRMGNDTRHIVEAQLSHDEVSLPPVFFTITAAAGVSAEVGQLSFAPLFQPILFQEVPYGHWRLHATHARTVARKPSDSEAMGVLPLALPDGVRLKHVRLCGSLGRGLGLNWSVGRSAMDGRSSGVVLMNNVAENGPFDRTVFVDEQVDNSRYSYHLFAYAHGTVPAVAEIFGASLGFTRAKGIDDDR